MQHFRGQLWRPRGFTRQPFETWTAGGSTDVEARVREEIRRILDEHRPVALPDSVTAAIERIKIEGEKRLART